MKNLITIILVLITVHNFAFSQSGWNLVESNTNQTLKTVQFIDAQIGYAAGGNEFLFTADGGNNWISRASGTLTTGINGMSFINAAIGWCTGTNGIIYTSNAGTSWVLQKPGSAGAINDIIFINSTTGWAVGTNGTILKTTNAGVDWNSQNSNTSEELKAVYFVSSANGWVVGTNAKVMFTIDGGTTWIPQSFGLYIGTVNDVHFTSQSFGWAAGNSGAVFKTTNGGSDWIKQTINNNDNYHFVQSISDSICFAGGDFGTIVKTSNYGNKWSILGSTVVVPLYDLNFVNMRYGWAVGTNGTIIRSASGGEYIGSDFVADTSYGVSPFTVKFKNKSTGLPTMFNWDFGDGGESTEENPTHIYTKSGTFDVSLTITSGTYTAYSIKEDYISVDNVLLADFHSVPTSGSATLTVNFFDDTKSAADSWLWEFGDDSTSTLKNPVHFYEYPGEFDISLTVTNYQGSNKTTKQKYITVYEKLQAAFRGTPRTGPAPLTVNFFDDSPGHPKIRLWDFGDGLTSSDTNPVHTYENSGTYTVSLFVSDGNYDDNLIKTSYIRVTDDLNPNFSASPVQGTLPLVVSFKDESYGGATQWSWNFGDGASSTQQNPVHTYILPGTYTVRLTIGDGTNTASKEKVDLISVTGTPVLNAGFSASPLSGYAPLPVQFTDQTEGSVLTYDWDFGDGGASPEKNPRHIYKTAGIYSVKLIVGNGLTRDTSTQDDLITILEPQSNEIHSDFIADITEGTKPLNIQFNDLSTGSPVSWNWDFGGGKTNSIQNPTEFFQNSGTFTVSLKVKDKDGNEDTEIKENYLIILEPISVEDEQIGNLIKLSSAYPNPFDQRTFIQYELKQNNWVNIKIYNELGNEIITLADEEQLPGDHQVEFNAKNLPQGTYYYKMSIGDKVTADKLILVK